MIESTDPSVGDGRGHETSRLASGAQTQGKLLPRRIVVHQTMGRRSPGVQADRSGHAPEKENGKETLQAGPCEASQGA